MEFIKQLPRVDKIAYFDPDVYFNCDVAEYYNIDLKDNYIGGVIDLVVYLILNHSNNKVYAERLSQYDLSADKNYICAGVTL
jgi:lipopolysaccharide biosynthesis glycosyltransferase